MIYEPLKPLAYGNTLHGSSVAPRTPSGTKQIEGLYNKNEELMKQLNELSTSELEELKIKMSAAMLAFESDKKGSQARLDNRLDRQAVSTATRTTLESNLNTAITLRDMAVANGADAATIAGAEELVVNSQKAVDDLNSPSTWVSDVDAHVVQAEVDDLQDAQTRRQTIVTEINTLLGV